jgi:ParB/RepB/Spo0J family partition protein
MKFMTLMNKENLKITWLPLNEIIPNTWNINEMTATKYNALLSSIKTRGFIEPIIVRTINNKWQIINGWHRYNVAKELNFTEIPCIIYNCDDNEAQFLTIGANEFRGETNLQKFSIWIDSKKESIDSLSERLGISKSILFRYASYSISKPIHISDNIFLTPFTFLIDSEKLNKIICHSFLSELYSLDISTLKSKEIIGNIFYDLIMTNKPKILNNKNISLVDIYSNKLTSKSYRSKINSLKVEKGLAFRCNHKLKNGNKCLKLVYHCGDKCCIHNPNYLKVLYK